MSSRITRASPQTMLLATAHRPRALMAWASAETSGVGVFEAQELKNNRHPMGKAAHRRCVNRSVMCCPDFRVHLRDVDRGDVVNGVGFIAARAGMVEEAKYGGVQAAT
jgi:hypothetical protein